MENTLYEHIRTLLEWKTIDATMTPGGSFANFMGLLLSRHKLLPETKTKGLYGTKILKVFTSDVSHYSIKKGVVLCGFGTDNIVSVKTD
jgi:glutamate/tyrosine decarboxylase-like PLP-dependent enzyme